MVRSKFILMLVSGILLVGCSGESMCSKQVKEIERFKSAFREVRMEDLRILNVLQGIEDGEISRSRLSVLLQECKSNKTRADSINFIENMDLASVTDPRYRESDPVVTKRNHFNESLKATCELINIEMLGGARDSIDNSFAKVVERTSKLFDPYSSVAFCQDGNLKFKSQ